MAFKGVLKDFDLASILQLVQAQSSSGRLVVKSRKASGTIDITAGRIVFADTQAPHGTGHPSAMAWGLFQYLLARHQFPENELRELLDGSVGDPFTLVQSVKVKGFLDENELSTYISQQLVGVMVQLFQFTEGRYEFKVDIEPRPILPGYAVTCESISLECMRVLDELQQIGDSLPLTNVFSVHPQYQDPRYFPTPGVDPWKQTAHQLLLCLDGRSDVAEIQARTFLPPHQVVTIMYRMVGRGLLQQEQRTPTGATMQFRAVGKETVDAVGRSWTRQTLPYLLGTIFIWVMLILVRFGAGEGVSWGVQGFFAKGPDHYLNQRIENEYRKILSE